MKITPEIIQAISEKYHLYIRSAEEYGEKGYSLESKDAILFSDWNNCPKFILKALEKQYQIEWSDEWYISDKNKAYRIMPDSYHWKPYYVISDGEVKGGDEIEQDKDIQEWYLSTLIDNPKAINLFDIDIESHGFTKVNQDAFQNGFHEGMTDDPKEIFKKLKEEKPDHEFIFSNFEPSQFYVEFDIYERKINDD